MSTNNDRVGPKGKGNRNTCMAKPRNLTKIMTIIECVRCKISYQSILEHTNLLRRTQDYLLGITQFLLNPHTECTNHKSDKEPKELKQISVPYAPKYTSKFQTTTDQITDSSNEHETISHALTTIRDRAY